MDHERAFLAAALSRAALDLAHSREAQNGIDPNRNANPIVLVVLTALYSAQKSFLGFGIRLVVKKLLVRVAAKVAMPDTAFIINGTLPLPAGRGTSVAAAAARNPC